MIIRAQDGLQLRSHRYAVGTEEILLDTLSVVPGTIIVQSARFDSLDPTFFAISDNRLKFHISFLRKYPELDSVLITYRTFPFLFSKKWTHLDTSELVYREEDIFLGAPDAFYADQNRPLVAFPTLQYGGSFARGFSIGNNQSLVLNSELNLQLAGDLGNGIGLKAAISDNNIPIQPEGNTRRIQEFDRVYIELSKAGHTLTAGDYNLERPTGHFINYYKKLTGVKYDLQTTTASGNGLSVEASGAITRGKFARNQITPQEGNQGPYRLVGTEGERFIIVLAGSEKVFLDGILLKRGFDEDYVVDYNRGELIFTRNRLIHKDVRIIVEFEYADQTYTRSLLAVKGTYRKENARFYFNMYSEQDGKNATGDLELDAEDKLLLQSSGDNQIDALKSTVRQPEEGFNTNRIMYILKDTTVGGEVFPVLEYSEDPDRALYTATFTDVGAGRGNYILSDQFAANGRVYQWVGPDPATGQLKGRFEPAVRLIAPKLQQMFSAGMEYDLGDHTRAHAEVVMSNFDLNRFSTLQNGDNVGLGVKAGLDRQWQLSDDWALETTMTYEFIQKHFRFLNPYRNAEFNRDWNISTLAPVATDEHLPGVELALMRGNQTSMAVRYSGLYKTGAYHGSRGSFDIRHEGGGFRILASGSILDSRTEEEEALFFRPKADISKVFPKLGGFRLGVYGEREENHIKSAGTDSLTDQSFHFDIYKIYLANPEDRDFHLNFSAFRRVDFLPDSGSLAKTSTADHLMFVGNWLHGASGNLGWNFTFRDLKINNRDLTGSNAGKTLIGRLDYANRFLKGALQYRTSIELGTGQEPRFEYKYVRVQEGEGTYIWVDDGNGIEEQNEFEIAPFPDQANYIRLNVQNNTFINTNTNGINQSVRFNMKPLFSGGENDFSDLMQRFALLSTVKYSRKTLEDDADHFWNPFYANFPDSALVALSSNWRNILSFNQSDPKYDIQIGQTRVLSRIAQTIGYEERLTTESFARFRYNLTSRLNMIVRGAVGSRSLTSERFTNRDYQLQNWEIVPEVTIIPSQKFRIVAALTLRNQNNTQESQETAQTTDISLDANFRQSAQSSIRGKFSFARVRFSGERNTPVEFAMLQGLKPGQNFLWGLQFDTRLNKTILLSFSYDGRKTGQARIVHTGNAQLKASF